MKPILESLLKYQNTQADSVSGLTAAVEDKKSQQLEVANDDHLEKILREGLVDKIGNGANANLIKLTNMMRKLLDYTKADNKSSLGNVFNLPDKPNTLINSLPPIMQKLFVDEDDVDKPSFITQKLAHNTARKEYVQNEMMIDPSQNKNQLSNTFDQLESLRGESRAIEDKIKRMSDTGYSNADIEQTGLFKRRESLASLSYNISPAAKREQARLQAAVASGGLADLETVAESFKSKDAKDKDDIVTKRNIKPDALADVVSVNSSSSTETITEQRVAAAEYEKHLNNIVTNTARTNELLNVMTGYQLKQLKAQEDIEDKTSTGGAAAGAAAAAGAPSMLSRLGSLLANPVTWLSVLAVASFASDVNETIKAPDSIVDRETGGDLVGALYGTGSHRTDVDKAATDTAAKRNDSEAVYDANVANEEAANKLAEAPKNNNIVNAPSNTVINNNTTTNANIPPRNTEPTIREYYKSIFV